MGSTFMVPALHNGPNEVPYPAAFERAKKFLKQLLRNLSEARDKFIHKIGALAALTELVRQLKMYARQEGPFSSPPSSDTLSWWRALSASLDANILAVCRLCFLVTLTYFFLSVPRNSNILGLCKLNGRRTDGVQLHMVQLWSAKSSECRDSYSVDPDSPMGPALGKIFFVRISVGMISVQAPQENQKNKPLERPVVAFCNIENEIYAKANKQVVDLTVEDLSEDSEGDQDKDANPVDKDSEFNLDDDVDLRSPLLDGMLSDRQPTPDQENIPASAAVAARLETRNHEPTEDDWENL